MRVRFECPTDFISSEIFEGLIKDNDNTECIILNPGSDIFYGKEYFDSFKDLKIVGTPSTGVNHIDRKCLRERGIKLYSLIPLSFKYSRSIWLTPVEGVPTIFKSLKLSKYSSP